MSTAAEKANLARIRDNQRRSRARRKEYLQELEARLRQCELQGIEASSEIQMAARKVADENKKLRSLLAQHGVGNDIVEPYLHLNSEDLIMSTQYGSESTSVQQLEHLLQTRKTCCGDGNGNIGPASATTMQTIQSRESSCSGNTVHSLWDPVHTSRSLSVGQTQTSLVDIKNASPAHQYVESRRSSATSRHSSISISQNHNTGRTIHTQQHQHQHQQQQQQHQQQQQRYNIPIALPNTQQQQRTPSSLSIQTQTSPIYDFDPQYLSSQSYNSISPQTYHMHSHSHSHSHSHLHSQSHPQPQSHQPHPSHQNPAHSHQTSPPLSAPYTTTLSSSSSHPNPSTNANTNNMNSCIFATDLIASISNSDSAIVRSELGCVSGMDCNVDNQLVFNVMDRYTGSGVGL